MKTHGAVMTFASAELYLDFLWKYNVAFSVCAAKKKAEAAMTESPDLLSAFMFRAVVHMLIKAVFLQTV